jgi:predicted nucleic acid-binding protein
VPVVDASIVVDWVAPGSDPDSPARRLLDRLVSDDARLFAPRLMLQETANALLSGVRRGRWDGTDADQAFQRLMSLPVRLDDYEGDVDRAWELSRRYDEHPLYDMVYVALTERLGERFITADERLRTKLVARGDVVGPDD